MKAWVAFLTVALVWGSYFFAIALAIESFTPFGLVATRYLAGGILALALSRALGEAWPRHADLPHLMLQGFLLLTAASALLSWAEGRISSGTTAALCSTTPLFYAVLGREHLDRRVWTGLLMGLGGVALLIFSRSGSQTLSLVGGAAAMLAVFLWAFGTLRGRRHVRGPGCSARWGCR